MGMGEKHRQFGREFKRDVMQMVSGNKAASKGTEESKRRAGYFKKPLAFTGQQK
jgi:hypothetical protein